MTEYDEFGFAHPSGKTHGIPNQYYVAEYEDVCIFCKQTYRSHDLDRDPECYVCEPKSDAWKEKTYRDNMAGQGVRLQERSAIPVKVGGQWTGGGLHTAAGLRAWNDAAQRYKRSHGIDNPWAQRERILDELVEEDNPDTYDEKSARRAPWNKKPSKIRYARH